jgi:polyhydroxyalkanoate synthesis regulator phasin
MFDLIKKSMLAGIGAVVITEEKIQELATDFVEKGKITQQEGKTLVDELQKVVQENKEKLSSTIDERVNCFMKELNLLTKDDLVELEKSMKKDLAKVERRLAKIEKQLKDAEVAS